MSRVTCTLVAVVVLAMMGGGWIAAMQIEIDERFKLAVIESPGANG